MLEYILKTLEEKQVIYLYEFVNKNEIDIIANDTLYNFKQKGNKVYLTTEKTSQDFRLKY